MIDAFEELTKKIVTNTQGLHFSSVESLLPNISMCVPENSTVELVKTGIDSCAVIVWQPKIG